MARIEVQGDKLVITCDLNVKPTLSKSGKSHMVDTTNGFTKFSTPFGTVGISLNVNTTDEGYGRDGRKVERAAPQIVKPANGAAASGGASAPAARMAR